MLHVYCPDPHPVGIEPTVSIKQLGIVEVGPTDGFAEFAPTHHVRPGS